MKDKSLVSVIMPAFNAENYIQEAIQSVVDQSYTNWELLIVDDGSTDSTSRLVHSFTDDRIKFKNQEHLGVSAARNSALKDASGDYVCFLDADDVLPKDSLAARLDIFVTNKEVSFVDGAVQKFEETVDNTVDKWSPDFEGKVINELLSLSGKCFLGNTWMIKRDMIKHGFNECITHGEELLFYIQNAGKGVYSYTDECVLFYRQHGASAMYNLDGLQKGYMSILNQVNEMTTVTQEQKLKLGKKIRMIMFKSFIAKGKFLKGLSTLFGIK